MASRVIILVGCSGSGKSTYARRQFPDARVVSADHYFEALAARTGRTYGEVWEPRAQGLAHRQCRERFLEALAEGSSTLVVDNTHVRAADRNPYVKAALAGGCDVEFHVLSPWRHGAPPPSPEAVDRYVGQCHARNGHEVPRAVVAAQFDQLELPSGIYRPGKPPGFLRDLPVLP